MSFDLVLFKEILYPYNPFQKQTNVTLFTRYLLSATLIVILLTFDTFKHFNPSNV